MKITPVVLSGGSGTRLWHLSRQHDPKQFLKLVGDMTLFQQSINRAVASKKNLSLLGVENLIVIETVDNF